MVEMYPSHHTCFIYTPFTYAPLVHREESVSCMVRNESLVVRPLRMDFAGCYASLHGKGGEFHAAWVVVQRG